MSLIQNQQSEIYQAFPEVYDQIMSRIPYLEWSSFLLSYFYKWGLNNKSEILELACGSGKTLRHLKPYFPNIIGLDISMGMLEKSQNRTQALLIQADIKSLPFSPKAFSAIYCLHNSINYIRSQKELERHFRETHRICRNGALYIFDIANELNIIKNFHRRTFQKNQNEKSIKWTNFYNSQSREILSTIKITTPQHQKTEHHLQKIHRPKEIEKTLQKTGWQIRHKSFDYNTTKNPPQLITYVASKI